MHRLTLPLDPGGPAINLHVSASSLGGPPVRVANPTLRTLIDTGAHRTCVDANWLRAAGLTPVDVERVRTASSGPSGVSCEVYDVALTVPGPPPQVMTPALRVLAIDLTAYRFQCLLGRDVLARCRFVYDGIAGRIELEF